MFYKNSPPQDFNKKNFEDNYKKEKGKEVKNSLKIKFNKNHQVENFEYTVFCRFLQSGAANNTTSIKCSEINIQRVPALHGFWDLKKRVTQNLY